MIFTLISSGGQRCANSSNRTSVLIMLMQNFSFSDSNCLATKVQLIPFFSSQCTLHVKLVIRPRRVKSKGELDLVVL